MKQTTNQITKSSLEATILAFIKTMAEKVSDGTLFRKPEDVLEACLSRINDALKNLQSLIKNDWVRDLVQYLKTLRVHTVDALTGKRTE